MKKFILIHLCFGLCSSIVFGLDDKATFDDSLNKTQTLLKDPSQRKKAVSETEDGKKADEQVKKLAPDAATQDEFYNLAADILDNYRDEKSEEGMKADVSAAKRDPTSFYKNLTPEQQEKVRKLGEKLNPGAQTNP